MSILFALLRHIRAGFSSLSLFPLWAVFWNLSFLWGFGTFLKSWPVLFRKIGFLALVEGAVFLFSLLGSYYGGKLSARVENDLRMTLFRHLTHLSFAFFDYSRTGKLMATLMGDISEAGDLVSRIPGDFAVSLVTAVGTIILLLYLNT